MKSLEENKKIGEPSPEAIAKRLIVLKWTKETNVDTIAGTWQAGYVAAQLDAASQGCGRWVSHNAIDLTLKTGIHHGLYNKVEKCLVEIQGGKVVKIKFSNGAQMSDGFRNMAKKDIRIFNEALPCPHEKEINKYKEALEKIASFDHTVERDYIKHIASEALK